MESESPSKLKDVLAQPVAWLRKEPRLVGILVHAVLDAPAPEREIAIDRLLQLSESNPQPTLRKALPPRIVELLDSKDATVRCIGARLVDARTLPAALPLLLRGLEDEDAQVREACATSLQFAGCEAQAMKPYLRSARPEVREAALRVLSPPILPSFHVELRRLLGDASPAVRHRAAELLPDEDGSLELWAATVDALASSLDEEVRIRATQRLARLQPRPETPMALVAALRTDSTRVRGAAADALAHFAPVNSEAAKALLEAIQTPDTEVGTRAAAALSARGGATEALIPQLMSALEDESIPEFVRGQVAITLGRLGARAVMPKLMRLLERPDESFQPILDEYTGLPSAPGLKRDAVEAIGFLGVYAAEAVPTLRRLAREGVAALRQAATEALKRMGASG